MGGAPGAGWAGRTKAGPPTPPGGQREGGGLRAGPGPGRRSWGAHPGQRPAPVPPSGPAGCRSPRRQALPPRPRPSPHPGGAAGMCRGRRGRFCSVRGAVSERRSSDSHFLSPAAARLQLRRLRDPLASQTPAPTSPARCARPQRQHGRRPGRGLGGGGPAPRGGRLLLHLPAHAGAAARRPGAAAATLPVRR